MKNRLSAKRQQIVDFILQFMEDRGYPPTVRDIQSGCGISSTSVVDYHLKVLEKEGHLRRDPEVSRGMELLGRTSTSPYTVQVPIIGQIAAGEPIPVPGSETWNAAAGADLLEVTADLTQGKQDIYALKVKGMSMIDALINDGDVVLMQYTSTVDNGEMAAVWLKAEKETTLKRFYREVEAAASSTASLFAI